MLSWEEILMEQDKKQHNKKKGVNYYGKYE